MAEILQRIPFVSPALTPTDDGLIFGPSVVLRGTRIDATVKKVVGGTGAWSTTLLYVEFSMDGGTTWLAGSGSSNKFLISNVGLDGTEETSESAVPGSLIRFNPIFLSSSFSPTMTYSGELRVY